MTEIEEIKQRIQALECHVGLQVKPWGWRDVLSPRKKKKKKKTVPQEEPAEVEAHPDHNWKAGNKGPRDAV